jgi:hypothetical protein
MTKFYYGWINDKFVRSVNVMFKETNSKLWIPSFRAFNKKDWWMEDYQGFFSRGFTLKDSSITYKRIENWLEYQDGKRTSILCELSLTEGTYYNE